MHKVPMSYYEGWLEESDANYLFSRLLEFIPWRQEHILIFGRKIKLPRLTAWIADSGINYSYSGISHRSAIPWPLELQSIRNRLNECFKTKFNSVLCNLYHTGQDYIGWHSDNEPELGVEPIIASISLGSERRLLFRHRETKQLSRIILKNGSLLLTYGSCQDDWEHCLPKMAGCNSARINLTFRKILVPV